VLNEMLKKLTSYILSTHEMDDLGLKSLELNSEILYHFVGPQEAIVPEHKRILSYGPKPHKK
jgi:hypothetical protein